MGWYGMGWYGMGWYGMGWVGLGWVGLGWVGLGWVGLFSLDVLLCLTQSYVRRCHQYFVLHSCP